MVTQKEIFDIDKLGNQVKSAALHTDARVQIKSILQATVDDPEWVSTSIPDYGENDVILYEDDTVSIWHCRFPVGETVPAHDHQMVAIIAVYQGTERNKFWVMNSEGQLAQQSEVVVTAGEVTQIDPTTIHSVACSSEIDSCAIHVYLGNLTKVERSLFDTNTGDVIPFDDENYNKLKTIS